ncbi:hypothetical protein J4448_01550 [Candidatus Woesearchaeota archaeon]|nr:hypothetical protein [Candidatus Woesearchaeota archaeon]
MEKLNKNVVALSVGITTALVYLVCLAFVAIFPLQTIVTVSNYFVHGIDISSIATKNMTLAKSVIGLIVVALSSAVVGYVFALIYNWLGEKF